MTEGMEDGGLAEAVPSIANASEHVRSAEGTEFNFAWAAALAA